MKKLVLYIMIVLIISVYLVEANSVYVNEIMFNPSGNDNNKEFVEVVGINNLSNVVIGDLVSNDTLELLQYCEECNLSLIVEEEFDYSILNCSIYSVGTTIGNGLSNTEDAVFLYYNDSLIDTVYFGGGQEGYSYFYYNGSWGYSELEGGTPCINNIIEEGFINQSINKTTNLTTNTTVNISINTTINITINNSEVCNISLSLRLKDNKFVFSSGDAIKFYNDLSDKSYYYTINYWIDDYFNNTLKSLVETTNTNQKQWTANIDGKYEFAVIKSNLSFVNCTNINNKTFSEIKIFIVNDGEESVLQDKDSSVEFDEPKISGNYVSVAGELYKGDTTKTVFSVKFQCKKENNKLAKSQEFKTYLSKKFSTQKFAYKLSVKEIIQDCYSDAEIYYSGLGLDGETDVEGFERIIKNPVGVLDKNSSIGTYVENISLASAQTFSQNSNSNVNIDGHFEEISSSMFEINEENSTVSVSQRITGSAVEESLEIESSTTAFIDILIVVLILSAICLIFFKKW